MRRPEDDPYEILGVERGATWEEIKEAYRRQQQKYHPDLNPGDKASGWITRRVIEAYEHLRAIHGTHGHPEERMPPERDPSGENDRGHRDRQAGEQQEQEARKETDSVASQQEIWEKIFREERKRSVELQAMLRREREEALLRARTQLAQDDTRATRGVTSERRTPWGLLVTALGGLILVALLASEGTNDRPDEAIPDSTLSDWRARLRADLDADVFESTPQTITEERTEAAAPQPPNTNTVDAVSSTANRVSTPTNTTPPRPLASSDFFSRGSHEDDVARIQGTPTEIRTYSYREEEVWRYGLSSVTFSTRTRRVIEWSNPTGALRVRMMPGEHGTEADFFSQGSHQDDVARIQGTPTEIRTYSYRGEEVWRYGLSSVTFSTRTRRVIEWSNPTGMLRVRIRPNSDEGNRG